MLASGAKRVVTTNWQVADDASADLVADFVGIINTTNSPNYGSALRTAKQTIRGGGVNSRWQHPYFWAPFVLIGPN
jgi:CHAT domain-containing protein